MTSADLGGGDGVGEVPSAGPRDDGGASPTLTPVEAAGLQLGLTLEALTTARYTDPTGTQPFETAKGWVAGCLFAASGLPADDPGSLAVARFFAALLDLVEAVEP